MIRNAAYAQAVRGPLLLVVFGILMLLAQREVMPFSRTWPVLVIVYGVLKLVERSMSPVGGLPPGGGAQ